MHCAVSMTRGGSLDTNTVPDTFTVDSLGPHPNQSAGNHAIKEMDGDSSASSVRLRDVGCVPETPPLAFLRRPPRSVPMYGNHKRNSCDLTFSLSLSLSSSSRTVAWEHVVDMRVGVGGPSPNEEGDKLGPYWLPAKTHPRGVRGERQHVDGLLAYESGRSYRAFAKGLRGDEPLSTCRRIPRLHVLRPRQLVSSPHSSLYKSLLSS